MQTIQHKQTSKSWVNAESLLSIKDTSNQYLAIPHSSAINFTNTSSFSVSMVLNPKQQGVILCKRGSVTKGDGNIRGWMLYNSFSTGNKLSFLISDGTDKNYNSNLSMGGRLYHVVLTAAVNGSALDIKMYFNGILDTAFTTASLSDFSNIRSLFVGRWGDESSSMQNAFNAAFLSIYNKALSQVEVSQLYDQIGIVPKSLHANCVGFWSMQERYGNKVYDSVESFNYAKPQLVKDPYLLSGFTTYTKGNESIGGSSIVYDSGTKTITITNGPTCGASGDRPRIMFNGITPTKAGVNYTAEIDSEASSGVYGFRIFGGNGDLYLPHSGTGREIKKVSFTAHSLGSQNNTYSIETLDNINNASIKIYSIKIYETAIGLPLTPNHADLIGYTDAEVGITGAQTTKLDFYNKTIATNGMLKLNTTYAAVALPASASPAIPAQFSVEFKGSLLSVNDRMSWLMTDPYFKGISIVQVNTDLIHVYIGSEEAGLNTNFSVIEYGGFTDTPENRKNAHFLLTVNTQASSSTLNFIDYGPSTNYAACDIKFYRNGVQLTGRLKEYQAYGVTRSGLNPYNPSIAGAVNISPSIVTNPYLIYGNVESSFYGFNILSGIADANDRYQKSIMNKNIATPTSLLSVNPSGTNTSVGYWKNGVYYTDGYLTKIAGGSITNADYKWAEAKSGLPELKNAILEKVSNVHYAAKFSVTAGTPLGNIFQGAYTIRVGVYIPDINPAVARMFLRFTGVEHEFLLILQSGKLVIREGLNTSSTPEISITTPGLYFITITRDSARSKVEFYVNYQRTSSTDPQLLDQLVPTGFTTTNQGSLICSAYRFYTSMDNRESSFKDHIAWMNNGLGTQQKVGNILHLDCNNIYDIAGTKYLQDLSPNATHLQLYNYTADQLNPAHADYVIKTINSLR